MKFCCEDFARQAGELQAPAGGGFTPSIKPNAQFVPEGDGTWNINGCCGGGCYVVTNMKFCPYCGATLTKTIALVVSGCEEPMKA